MDARCTEHRAEELVWDWELEFGVGKSGIGYAEERIITGSLWSGDREPPSAMCRFTGAF